MRRLRILTWHVHGSYLLYLSHVRHELYLPVKPGRPPGYAGRAGPFPWPENVHELPAESIREQQFDCVLFQAANHYLEDQFELLSPEQRELPRIYLEHDPPRSHPTDTRHIAADDPRLILVHVTPFNALMWDSGHARTRVVEHGVTVPPDVEYSGEIPRGVVVINNLATRGRRLGLDVYETVLQQVPLDLVGMSSLEVGGIGEIPHNEIPRFVAQYRFFFNPIRYTSLGLAVCEAMMLGVPVVALATTEMTTAVQNGVTGYADTNVDSLVDYMRRLINDPAEARRLGNAARKYARGRFDIERFARNWEQVFEEACASPPEAASGANGQQTASEATGESPIPMAVNGGIR